MSILKLYESVEWDIKCEKCGKKYRVSWDDGEPVVGDHSPTCPHCGASIYFEVYYQYIQ